MMRETYFTPVVYKNKEKYLIYLVYSFFFEAGKVIIFAGYKIAV